MTGQGTGVGGAATATARGVTQQDIDNWFIYHPPTGGQLQRYSAIREAGKELALVILANTPAGADQTAAIREIRTAVMVANQAIALEGG